MSEEAVRTCVSCAYFKGQENEIYNPHAPQRTAQGPECTHPRASSRDMVYGKAFCLNERNSNKGCGRKGKLWEARENKKD